MNSINPTFAAALISPVGSAEQKPRTAPQFDEVDQLIAEAAYFLAEKRGFAPGHETEDWLKAETEVHKRLAIGDRDR